MSWSAFLVLFLFYLFKLKKELVFLQPVDVALYAHPLENSYLKKEIPKITWQIDSPYIFYFATPKCSHCHSELEYLIELQNCFGKVPARVFLPVEDKNTSDFINKYKELVEIEVIPYSEIADKINSFPTIALIDIDTSVIALSPNSVLAYNFMKNKLLKGEKVGNS